MSDNVLMAAPTSVSWAWFDDGAASDQQGLGCTSNGKLAVCTFGDRSGHRDRPYLKAYDANGRVRWTSGTALDAWAWTSAAMVATDGGAVAADDQRIVRFSPGGKVRWRTRTPGGEPISPTHTADGTIVLATSDGPLSAYDPASGRRLATLDLRAKLGGRSGRFDTTNTPGTRGNRVYVSTQFTVDGGKPDPGHHARLYAIDVDARHKRLKIAWHYTFGARSGASPLVVGDRILFDGDRASPSGPFSPRFFALRDRGKHPELLWRYELGGPGAASAARDPRGGAWVFALGQRTLRRLDLGSGRVLQTLDVGALSAGAVSPFSAMSIARGPDGDPVMIVSVREALSARVLGIGLSRGTTLWSAALPGPMRTNTPEGQFPILAGPGGSSTVVMTTRAGVRALTGPGATMT